MFPKEIVYYWIVASCVWSITLISHLAFAVTQKPGVIRQAPRCPGPEEIPNIYDLAAKNMTKCSQVCPPASCKKAKEVFRAASAGTCLKTSSQTSCDVACQSVDRAGLDATACQSEFKVSGRRTLRIVNDLVAYDAGRANEYIVSVRITEKEEDLHRLQNTDSRGIVFEFLEPRSDMCVTTGGLSQNNFIPPQDTLSSMTDADLESLPFATDMDIYRGYRDFDPFGITDNLYYYVAIQRGFWNWNDEGSCTSKDPVSTTYDCNDDGHDDFNTDLWYPVNAGEPLRHEGGELYLVRLSEILASGESWYVHACPMGDSLLSH